MYEKDFEVTFDHIGNSNCLKPAGILKIFQEAGGLHSSSVGYGLNDLPNTHVAWIILNWNIKILKSPIWNTKLHIKTWSRGADRFYCYRDYELYDDEGLVALGSSKWVLFNVEKQSIEKISDEIISVFCTNPKYVLDETIDKLNKPERIDSSFHYTVLRRDIDTNLHVNNVNYLHYAYEALPEEVFNMDFNHIEVMYKNSAKLHDAIVCNYTKVSDVEHIVAIKSDDDTKLYAIIRFSNF